MAEISPKAIVLNPAGLAEDAKVGPFSFIGPEASVGSGTTIANNVTITGRTRIGSSCRLFPGCIVGCPPNGLEGAQADLAACSIADGSTLREHVIVEAGAGGRAREASPEAEAPPDRRGTVVGVNNLLMVGCQVGHDARLEGEGIEKFVRTSGFTNVGPYATVGAYTFTTGYACVDRDAPPYTIVQGYPFRVRSINTENLRRCGFAPETIELLKRAFRMLFNGQGSFPAVEQLSSVEQSFDNEEVKYLVASIRRSSSSPAGRWLQPAE